MVDTHESTVNVALAEVLGCMRRAWRVHGEPLQAFTSGKRPDILVVESEASPVIVENELYPRPDPEKDAVARIGEIVAADGRVVEASVALRTPARFRGSRGGELREALVAAADLEYALFSGSSPDTPHRWPSSGWIVGGCTDLATLIQASATPQSIVDAAADELAQGVEQAAGLFSEAVRSRSDLGDRLADELRQEDDGNGQTRRMAMTVIANAFVFHEALTGWRGIRGCAELRQEAAGVLTQDTVLDEWRNILRINYWPIFDIACRLVAPMDPRTASQILDVLSRTAARLRIKGVSRSHDLTGVVFQRLIADRKCLATFYTSPPAAALLACLAIPDGNRVGFSRDAALEPRPDFTVADFACGTGTLLSAAYQQIARHYEAAGGDAEAAHPAMMEGALIGCDVLPSAVHLTASMLSGVYPQRTFEGTKLLTLGYGGRADGVGYALGSLELLSASLIIPALRPSAPRRVTGGVEEDAPPEVEIAHNSVDLVIMNPPFTRPTNHEGMHADIPNPAYAAFGVDKEEQAAMSSVARRLGRELRKTSQRGEKPVVHGNAGTASFFVALADCKVREGGTIAMVLPLSAMVGGSWQGARDLWRGHYDDLMVVTVAGTRSWEKSFSADTAMGECLVIGRKRPNRTGRGTFVVLSHRPASVLEGYEMARIVQNTIKGGSIRHLEDGPFGGAPIVVGDDAVGQILDAPLPVEGPWHVVGVEDLSLAQAAYQLEEHGRLWLPGMPAGDGLALPMARLDNVSRMGPVDRDINGRERGNPFRGPFDIQTPRRVTATFPALWAHDAERERTMAVEPDSEAVVRRAPDTAVQKQVDAKAQRIWETATRAHYNRDLRFNSQSLIVAMTERPAIGGRAWSSIIFSKAAYEEVFSLWCNSTLGLLCHWWHSNRAQSGRGTTTVTSVPLLPVLDMRRLDPEQLETARALYGEMKGKPMLPFNEAHMDRHRRELDRRLCTDVLRLRAEFASDRGPLALLRAKLCAEPSIHGGKKSLAVVAGAARSEGA